MKITSINYSKGKFLISLKVSPYFFSTNKAPWMKENLLETLPGLRYHVCHNGRNHDFAEELNDTILAHAFEHVLLEVIGIKDYKANEISGWTFWNWKKNPRWTYQIEIKYSNKKIFFSAIRNSMQIIKSAYLGEPIKKPHDAVLTISNKILGV